MIELRDYQREAIDHVLSYWADGGGNPLCDMATGTGKSVVIATLTRELLEQWPDMRVLCLVHVKELVSQNAHAMLRAWPQAPIGINSAGLGRRDTHSKILFAGIQSVYRQDGYSLGPRDLILIDECHLVPRSGEGMYRTLLDKLRERVPDLRVAGFSATPYRLDSGRLDQGEDRLFSKIVYSYGIGRGIKDGWLAPLVSKATTLKLNVANVQRRGGEFVPGSLEHAVDRDPITHAAVDELVAYGENRRSWLVFASGVKHAEHLRDAIRARGIGCETVTGETPSGERDRIIRDFRAGKLRCITNMGVLTTGFDVAQIDLIAMLRPTLSTGLYVQKIGRGTRLAPGKENCLVLDFAKNVWRHGPVDAIDIKPTAEKSGVTVETVRAKECPDCHTLVALNTRTCPTCGHEWAAPREPKHEASADAERPILSSGAPAWLPVHDVRFYPHHKEGSPTSLRVEYRCGLTVHRAWICVAHDGYPQQKAHAWWRRMGGSLPFPVAADEAILRTSELQRPTSIQVRPSGKYFEIVGYKFSETQAEKAA